MTGNYYHDKDNCNTLQKDQDQITKKKDTFKETSVIPVGSTVVVLSEVGGSWTHDTVTVQGDGNHIDQFYKLQLTKIGYIISRNARLINSAAIYTRARMKRQERFN